MSRKAKHEGCFKQLHAVYKYLHPETLLGNITCRNVASEIIAERYYKMSHFIR